MESEVLGTTKHSPENIMLESDGSEVQDILLQPISGSENLNRHSESIAHGSYSQKESNLNMTSVKFTVDKDSIPSKSIDEQDEELKKLGVCAYDQVQFEAEVMDQVDQAMQKEEERRFKMRMEKEMKSAEDEIQLVKKRVEQLEKIFRFTPDAKQLADIARKKDVLSLKKEYDSKLKQLQQLQAKHKSLKEFISGEKSEGETLSSSDIILDEDAGYMQQALAPKESEEEHLIRTGEMTPFGTVTKSDMEQLGTIGMAGSSTYGHDKSKQHEQLNKKLETSNEHDQLLPKKHVMGQTLDSKSDHIPSILNKRRFKQSRKKIKLGSKYASGIPYKRRKKKITQNFNSDPELSDFENEDVSDEQFNSSDDEYIPDQLLSDDSDHYEEVDNIEKKKDKKDAQLSKGSSSKVSAKKSVTKKKRVHVIDDGKPQAYVNRIKLYEKQKLVEKHKKILESEDGIVESDEEDCVDIDGEFKVPTVLWNKLYRYQKTCVRWLWELHRQNCGGIVGDEMGLGKTIQVIVFLAGLGTSKIQINDEPYQGLGPVLLVCPVTVMHQWVKEFHSWWPMFRVAILHDSGSFVGKKENLIDSINRRNGVLITSYAGLVQHQVSLLSHEWHYIILDEGHKIRNPDAQVTLVAKQVRTVHRLILSGSPIQNNLKELWSLFDFIFPGKLGTLPTFMQQFSVPIVQGGYANASQVQVQTAYKCATILRDTIKPYLLRRTKADVKMSINLPNKNEQVLFCKLTDDQIDLYKDYLASPEVKSILNARLQVFVGLIHLRKICNHPDLHTGGPKIFKDTDLNSLSDDMQYGYYKRAGKMIVVDALLRLWHKQGHRVLLFTQSRQMMVILEMFVKRREYTYMKMDGATTVSSRQPAIEKFNSDPSIFVFLLTTRVGGLGVNLTGANRIILYDPDWNPSTDAQAKERSWRIGQEKQVTIYRLLTAGTIEEKIYHRQIFKQFVTNRVLKDPRQRRFFKSNDLYELFTFTDIGKEGTETSAIFAGTGSEIRHVPQPKMSAKSSSSVPSSKDIKASFSAEKIAKMKELAKKISSQMLASPNTPSSSKTSPSQDSTKATSNLATIKFPPGPIKKDQKLRKNTENTHHSHKCERTKLLCDSKHKKKRQKRVAVDGKEIDYLVKKDIFNPSNEQEDDDSKKDDYVLSKLFKKSGVHTALRHDVIVDASDPDYMIVEEEANRVAREAVKILRESRRRCAHAREGIPTWTGTNGGQKPRFGLRKVIPMSNMPCMKAGNKPSTSGLQTKVFSSKSSLAGSDEEKGVPPSSSELLDSLQKTNMFPVQNIDSDSDVPTLSIDQIRTETELLDEIRSFVAFRAATDGQATTNELLQEFKPKLPIELTAVFKALLTKICDFSRTSSGDGLWNLKPEFQ